LNLLRSAALLAAGLTLVSCGGAAATPPTPAGSAAAQSAAAAKPATSTAATAPASPAASAKPADSAQAAAAASAAAKPAATTEIRIGQIPSTAAAPFFVPTEDGTFASRGLKVSITPVTDTAQTMIQIAGGQLEMGTVTLGAAALNAFARGTDMTIIASGGIDPPGHGAFAPVVVRSDLMDSGKVKTLADLKGLKVALNARGVILEYSLYRALKLGGLTLNDVDVVTMPWPDMVAAMSNKNLDVGLIGNPLAAQAVAKGVGKILSDDYAPNNQNSTVTVNSKWLQSHRDAAVTFLEVYLQTIRKLADGGLKRDAQAMAIIEKATKTPVDVIQLAPDPTWPKDGKINVQSIEDQQSYFFTTKALTYSQPLDINRLIDYGPLDQALKNIGAK
jgi:NitT/TauT family transport system substrate-binding protein